MEDSSSLLNSMGIDLDQEIEVFVDDKIFTVSMSGFFAKRLQGFADWVLSSQDPEKMIKIYEKISEKPDDVLEDLEAFNIQTMIMLMQAVQTSAKNQDALEKTTIRKIQDTIQNTEDSIEDTSELSSDADA